MNLGHSPRRLPGLALAPALSLAFLALPLAGCGQQAPTPREQVSRYISQVKRVESALTPPLTTVTRVSALVTANGGKTLLGQTKLGPPQQELNGALRQIHTEQARLRALRAPAQAATLRSLLIKLTSAEAALTSQLALLVAFLPRFNAASAPLQRALARLEHVLSERKASGAAAVSALYAAKAAALRRFRATTEQLVARLHRLKPPLVSRPAYKAQLASMRGMGTSAGRLATALEGGTPGNVTPLLIAFDRAALATHTRAVQRGQIAAIRAWDAKTAQLTTLSEAISRERLRLAETLK